MLDRVAAGIRAILVVACTLFALAVPGSAQSKKSDAITITFLASSSDEQAWPVVISNFERVYPSITVQVTYAPNTTINQLLPTELAAGSGPDVVLTQPGCGSTVSICELAKDGDLAPMVHKPWNKRSLPLVTSLDKHGPSLYAFEPGVTVMGMLTNDDLFEKLGLAVPQTFSQLLDVCQKAKADGTPAVLVAGGNAINLQILIVDLAAATVYGKDKHWAAKQEAGTVTFDGTPGWHQALQELIDMNNAGCFEPGVAGSMSEVAPFAAGQGLMLAGLSNMKPQTDALNAGFNDSFHPFPGGTVANQTETFVNLSNTLSVNAHSAAQNQAAAQTFIDFVARPEAGRPVRADSWWSDAVRVPEERAAVVHVQSRARPQQKRVRDQPGRDLVERNVQLTLETDEIGLITGQTTIDDLLSAMDAAWKQGPS